MTGRSDDKTAAPAGLATAGSVLVRRHGLHWAALAAVATAGFVVGALEPQPSPAPDPLLNLAFSSGDVFDVP